MLKKLDSLAVLFLVLGGLVWGVYGLYRVNVIEYIFDQLWLIRILYVLFGIALICHLVSCRKDIKKKRTKR